MSLKYFFSAVFFLLFLHSLNAQRIIIHPEKTGAVLHENSAGAVREFLLKHYFSNNSGSSLQCIQTSVSPYLTYYTFSQTFDEIPVEDAMIKIAVSSSGKIAWEAGNYFNTNAWNLFDKTKRPVVPEDLIENLNLPGDRLEEAIIIVDENDVPQLVTAMHITDPLRDNYNTLLFDETGTLLRNDDHRVYFDGPDSLVTGMVFLPDPLTTAEVFYGDDYMDFDDADSPALNLQRIPINFKTDFENDTFFLKNDHIILRDINAPASPVVYSLTPDFEFTRNENGFEDVNVFFHITNFDNYIISLGDTALQNFQIDIDPHGASGADNSFYAGGLNPQIQYGEGGVDDAEDADVIIHEYTHALSDHAATGTNVGLERYAMDEGYGDYFAVSYSRGFSDFNWQFVFSWDGHNEFWPGRNANTDKHYPEDKSGDYYATSEIWSGALMDIFDAIGKENTDKIVMEALYGSYAYMSLPDGAQVILQAEAAIFDSLYYDIVYNALDARGLINPVAVNSISSNSAIQINNSFGFTTNHEPLDIELPAEENYSITLTSVDGKIISTEYGTAKNISFQHPENASGIFLLSIKTDSEIKSVLLVSL